MNGDALQLYRGLPVITNKLPENERQGIPHHLLGCIDLQEPPWTVRDFSQRAKRTVDDIRSRGKLPIVVGGTHYYVQSILSRKLILGDHTTTLEDSQAEAQRWPILNDSTENIFKELQKVDPLIARRWHPKDRRKIQRSLEIWLQTGQRPSELYSDQSREFSKSLQVSAEDGARQSSDDILILWTHALTSELLPRLERRVEEMVVKGLLDEAEMMYDFVQRKRAEGFEIDGDRGIFIAIGYKEFLPFLTADGRSASVKAACLERTNIATRQYARQQTRWIRHKLLPVVAENDRADSTFLLDASNLDNWHANVEACAADLTESFLHGSKLPSPKSLSDLAHNMLKLEERPAFQSRQCDACGKTLMTESEWESHLRSKGHRHATRPARSDRRVACDKPQD